MNTANNLTRCRVSLVWLSTVAIALMLVVLNIAPVAAQSTEMVMLSNLGEAEAERYQRIQIGLGCGLTPTHNHSLPAALPLRLKRSGCI